jgi:hypothetical protein
LKNLKDSDEHILFHDKILDKLFHLLSYNYVKEFGNAETPVGTLIFETIIMMVDLFQNRYHDYKDEILETYISSHFSQGQVYKPLLAQIEKVSLTILGGIVETKENEEKNAYVLMTMKYLGTILKIVKNSFLEALSC